MERCACVNGGVCVCVCMERRRAALMEGSVCVGGGVACCMNGEVCALERTDVQKNVCSQTGNWKAKGGALEDHDSVVQVRARGARVQQRAF
eukprot:353109-Chlamydomonas_euryale.AAC.4